MRDRTTIARSSSSKSTRSVAAALAGALLPVAAQAHGFGQRFDLPLPLWLWVAGAGLTLVLTFVALALFAGGVGSRGPRRSADLLRSDRARGVARAAARLGRGIAVALFAFALACGFLGSQDPYRNPIVALVWIGWWVGLAFVCALVGDLWEAVDPLRTLYRGAVRVLGLPRESLALPYPTRLGVWPAVVAFFAFAWMELLWADKDVPSHLAGAVLAYACVTWLGMALFGVETWRRRGDAFALAFALLGRFAPLEVRSAGGGQGARLRLRPYGAGLLDVDRDLPRSFVVFVLLMLATVTFDGFHQTPAMERIETAAVTWRPSAQALYAMSERGFDEGTVLRTVLLAACVAVFAIAFRLAVAASSRLGEGRPASDAFALASVLTLVPIAVAYHLSHYATLLVTMGQFLVPLASDPFARGWDLFGTRQRAVRLDAVSPYVYWYGSVALVVAGHVLSVVVAHTDASRRFATQAAAVRSQIPMLLLMVAYTCASLWIMAQPIVG